MTDAERMAWLSENAIVSKWDHRTGWTVHGFGCTGNGATFAEALDRAIAVSRTWNERARSPRTTAGA